MTAAGNPTANAYGDPPIAGYAPWVKLNYVSQATREQTLTRGWYNQVQYTACNPRPEGVTCDEFPNFSTAQSGPPNSRPISGPTASLRTMPTTPTNPNVDEGNPYSGFLAGCTLL